MAVSYIAQDIIYTKTDGTTTDVQTALNELYEKKNTLTFYINTFRGNGSNNSGASFYTSNFRDYKYYKITQTSTGTSTNMSIEKYNWYDNGSHVSLSLNTKYEINTTVNEEIFFTPNTGYRLIKIEFFKE